jgi:predicted transcriptional regulator
MIVTLFLAVQTGQHAPGFELPDQFNKKWKLDDLKGKVVVVVVANRNSGKAMAPWVDKLKASYADKIQLLGLLDLHDIPGIGRGMAKSRIRKETKDPMMLDFKGNTAKAHEVTSKCPVTVVIDKAGVAKAIQKTNCTPDALRSITDAIDAAIKAK